MPSDDHISSSGEEPRDQVIAVLDILGFSEIVQRRPLSEVMSDLRRAQRDADANRRRSLIDIVPRGKGLAVECQATEVRFVRFSDTLLCWADTSPKAIRGFLASVSCITASMNFHGFPVRGGISVGQCVIDEHQSEFVGLPIIEAALVEKRSCWAGVAFHPTCARHQAIREHLDPVGPDVVQHPVPEKAPDEKHPTLLNMQYAINWPEHFHVNCIHENDPSRARLERFFEQLSGPAQSHTAAFYALVTGYHPKGNR